ncbi:MAG: RloB family protein [Pirellulales bacterium]
MGKRDRQRRQARRPAYRESKPIILVVTEGTVTEPEYLKGFAKSKRNPRVQIVVVEGAGVPKSIVESAKELKQAAEKRARREDDENLKYDEVWCVFDVDQHPNIPEAIQMARDNGMQLAISNPCIELWLWLHFAEQPGMQQRQDLQRMIKRFIATYNKHVDFSVFANGFEDAVRRASRLDSDAEAAAEPGRNPTTGFWKLMTTIDTST